MNRKNSKNMNTRLPLFVKNAFSSFFNMGSPSATKFARNKNVIVIGGSGSGKTRFYVKPNIMQMHSSYIVNDPRGFDKKHFFLSAALGR